MIEVSCLNKSLLLWGAWSGGVQAEAVLSGSTLDQLKLVPSLQSCIAKEHWREGMVLWV